MKNKYWRYWKRGWWVFGMIFILNVSTGLMVYPVSIIALNNDLLYWGGCILILVIVGLPFWGWLFERFASRSARLMTPSGEENPS